ncbi:D-alanine--D-alanine ligase family protein [Synechococcus sp. MIT S9220]|uniref:D-alanine--D-alanine ligase family protein n=1 Tax=unclassified Synechococcus TaxID=2626047 RepID=UPI00164B8F84|nr:D-alanine--D-alanine ligase family protein [Synechococcus sp. MIT S9220]NOL47578.1 D-alanine--D-alanine ligase [Synechococcus sp. MIT S9220]QNJ22034.1 D-alanine--D-alanine ligase family protein [Synechococcus sp. MIT S9220]
MPTSPLRVGVVFGGASGEHDVSIRSASTVIKALGDPSNRERFQVTPLYIDREGRWWPDTIAQRVLQQMAALADDQLPQPLPTRGLRQLPLDPDQIDVWYPVLHGPNGEDGTVQGLFTLMQQPFVGSGVLGSAVGMDKLMMKAAFADAGLSQVAHIEVNAADLNNPEQLERVLIRLEKELGYPCFVKPANLGSSVGISKVRNRDELLAGLRLAAELDPRLVVEQGVKARELECAVLGRTHLKASVVGEVRFDADWYDYETKYTEGRSQTLIPAPLPDAVSQRIQAMAIAACRAVHAYGQARVDVFYDEANGQIWLNEINTLPGFTSQSMYPTLWEASGIPLPQLVAELVATAQE